MDNSFKNVLIALFLICSLVVAYYSYRESYFPQSTAVFRRFAKCADKAFARKSTMIYESEEGDDETENIGEDTKLESAVFPINKDDVYRHLPPSNDTFTTIAGWDVNVFRIMDENKVTFMIIRPLSADPYKHLIAPFSYQWIGSKELCDYFVRDRGFGGKGWYGAKRLYRLHNYYNSTCVLDPQLGLQETTLWPKYFKLATQAVQQFEGVVPLLPDISHHHPNITTYLVIMRNAWSNAEGHTVIWDKFRFAEIGCYNTNNTVKADSVRPEKAYERVFVIAQRFHKAIFHSINEGVSRIIPYLPFLRSRPDIAILTAHNPLMDKMLQLLGISPDRIVQGHVFARALYMPEGTPCVQVLPIQTQLMYQHIQEAIQKKVHHTKRNLVILITRKLSKARHFNDTDAVRTSVREEVEKAGFEFWEFGDDPLPDFETTINKFSQAAMVVGGHGAGFTNMLFVPPGGFIVEVLCDGSVINMCFQRLAGIIGHRYYGLKSRKGCLGQLTPDLNELRIAVRTYVGIIARTKPEKLWPKWVRAKRLNWQTEMHGDQRLIREFITSDKTLFDKLQTRAIYQGWNEANWLNNL